MHALRWDAKVQGDYVYAMPNPVCVTDHVSKAILFAETAEANKFKEEHQLKCFTIVDVDETTALEDAQKVFAKIKEKALYDFSKAICDAKQAGIDVKELHQYVDSVEYEN